MRDAQALANAIEDLINNHDLRSKMGEAGRRLMMNHFDDADVANSTIQIYKQSDKQAA